MYSPSEGEPSQLPKCQEMGTTQHKTQSSRLPSLPPSQLTVSILTQHTEAVIQLHVLANSNVLAVEAVTHDIVVYDSTLRFVKRVPGVQRMPSSWEFMEPQLTRIRKVHFCRQEMEKLGSDYLIPWISGVNSASVISVKTFQHRQVPKMWDHDGKPAFANVLAASSDQNLLFGIGQLEQAQTLHLSSVPTVTSPSKARSALAKSLLPQSKLRRLTNS